VSIQNMLTAALFRRDQEGRTVMYPNGAMGRGYLVPDAATEQKMRRTLMWLVIGSGVFAVVGMQVMTIFFGPVHLWTVQSWVIAMAALVALAVGYRALMRALVQGLTPVGQRMGMLEALKRQAEAMPRWYLWFLVIFAPLLVAGSILWMAEDGSMMNRAVGLVGVLLFGAATVQAIYGLMRRQQA
jgi:hypothetical protein